MEESPLLQSMSAALRKSGSSGAGLRVSVTRTGQWYQPKAETERYWVKWLSWSVVAPDGRDLTEPELAVVDGDFDQADFGEHLRAVFPKHQCIVDNEIDVGSSG